MSKNKILVYIFKTVAHKIIPIKVNNNTIVSYSFCCITASLTSSSFSFSSSSSSSASYFYFLNIDTQLVHHYLLKSLFFLHKIAFAPLLKINWSCTYGSISGLYSVLLMYMFGFPSIANWLDYSSHIVFWSHPIHPVGERGICYPKYYKVAIHTTYRSDIFLVTCIYSQPWGGGCHMPCRPI